MFKTFAIISLIPILLGYISYQLINRDESLYTATYDVKPFDLPEPTTDLKQRFHHKMPAFQPSSLLVDYSGEFMYIGTGNGHVIKYYLTKEAFKERGITNEVIVEPLDFTKGLKKLCPLLSTFDELSSEVNSDENCGKITCLTFNREGDVLICNSRHGIYKYSVEYNKLEKYRNITIYANDVMREYRNIFFTEPSPGFSRNSQLLFRLLMNPGRGNFNSLQLATKLKSTKKSGLGFPTGVVWSINWKYIFVAETAAQRIWRYSIEDGKSELLVENLPFMPFSLSIEPGTGAVVTTGLIPSTFGYLMRKFPVFIKVLYRLLPPERYYDWIFKKCFVKAGIIAKVDYQTGDIREFVYDKMGEHFAYTTAVQFHDDMFFVASELPFGGNCVKEFLVKPRKPKITADDFKITLTVT